jgi:hypothetical protein
LDDDTDLPRQGKRFYGNKKLRQHTLTKQWPPEEVLRPPDFGQQEDPLPNGWVSRFDQLSGEEYFFCEETEDLVFSREDLFRKNPEQYEVKDVVTKLMSISHVGLVAEVFVGDYCLAADVLAG